MGTSTKTTRSCNLGCSYCYQTNARVVHNAKSAHDYDIDAMVESIEREWAWEEKNQGGSAPTVLHGGEPLLMKKADLERLCKLNYDKHKKGSIQTNGVLLDDDHISIFKKFNIGVGVSIDGWGHLNISRQMGGDIQATLATTNKTLENMLRLCELHRPPGLITVLSRANAVDEPCSMEHLGPGDLGYSEEPISKRDHLLNFLDWCAQHDIRNGRLNPCHVDVPWLRPMVELTNDELAEFWQGIIPYMNDRNFHFGQICEIRDVLIGLGQQTCTKTYCDPINTQAERPIQEDGSIGNCEHVYAGEGVPFLRAEDNAVKDHRYILLAATPWEDGGCKGGPHGQDGENTCRWWAACSGQCPGQALDGDHRYRTRFCESWAALYQAVDDDFKKFMPNVKTLPDIASHFDPHKLYYAVHNCRPPWNPFALLSADNTSRPSMYKGDSQANAHLRVPPSKLYAIQLEVPSGTLVTGHGEHGDIDHGDHGDHGDSDNPSVAQPLANPHPHGDVLHGDHDDHGDSG